MTEENSREPISISAQNLYVVALGLRNYERENPGATNRNYRTKIDFDVDNEQVRILATLDAEVTTSEKGALIGVKPLPVYDSPQSQP